MTRTDTTSYLKEHASDSYASIARATGLSEEAVRRRLRALGLLKRNIGARRAPKGTPVTTVDPATGPPEISYDDRVRFEKERMLRGQRESEERSEARRAARESILLDTLREAVTPLVFTPPRLVMPKTPDGRTPETAVLLLSDTHFGKRNSLYDIAIATARLCTIVDRFLDVIAIQRRSVPIPDCIVMLSGDMVDGEGIYPTQSHHIDGHMVNQIFGVLPAFVQQIARLSAAFERVTIPCVRGNHGRVGTKTAGFHEESNWDNLFYKTAAMACVNLKNVEWRIPLGWHQVVEARGVKILQAHGHQIKMVLNLPWYGITTRISRWAITEGIGDFDLYTQGHFHSSSYLRWSSLRIFTNGTTVAGDEFALEFLGMESSESQWCFGVHPTRKVSWQYELDPNA